MGIDRWSLNPPCRPALVPRLAWGGRAHQDGRSSQGWPPLRGLPQVYVKGGVSLLAQGVERCPVIVHTAEQGHA